jgi:3-oxoacyl-[acyl-carrier protein] reductase
VFITYYREPVDYTPQALQAAESAAEGGDPLYRARQQQDAGHVLAAISAAGGTAVAHELDLGVPANIPQLFELCKAELGEVDILINNHTHCVLESFDPARESAISGIGPISAAQIDAHFAINARAVALLMDEYLQRFLQRKATAGRIINISTDAAQEHAENVHYAASKHAIESYSRSAAVEMGRYGITVNIVAPGPIQTGYITPKAEAHIAARTPLGRLGTPEDVADAVLLLATEQARWITGQLIYVGGGWRMGQ